jgi:hypothetical protein
MPSIIKFLVALLFIKVLYVLYPINQTFTRAQNQNHSFIPPPYEEIVENIYQFNFLNCDSLLNQISKTETETPWFLLIKSNYYWWLILTGEETKETLKQFDFYISKIITQLGTKKIESLSNTELYIIANAYAFKTRLALYKSSYISAATNLNNCIRYIEQTLNKEKEYEPFYLIGGLYNYFVDFAKTKYPIIKPYIATLPSGSISKGFSMLYKIAKSPDRILNNEANYFLCKLYQETEKNYPLAEKYAEIMIKRYPNNIAYVYNYFDILLNMDKKNEAIKELVKINLLSKTLPGLTPLQRNFYLIKAQNDLKKYYKKQLN